MTAETLTQTSLQMLEGLRVYVILYQRKVKTEKKNRKRLYILACLILTSP